MCKYFVINSKIISYVMIENLVSSNDAKLDLNTIIMTMYFAWKFCSRSFYRIAGTALYFLISYYFREPIVNRH